MKKFIKPLVFAVIASSLVSIASATPAENYDWMRTVQLNPALQTTFQTVGNSFFLTNPEINKQHVLVVTSPAVCTHSRQQVNIEYCWIGARDISLGINAYATKTTNAGHVYDVAQVKLSPYIRLSYTRNVHNNQAMSVQDVEVMSVQQNA